MYCAETLFVRLLHLLQDKAAELSDSVVVLLTYTFYNEAKDEQHNVKNKNLKVVRCSKLQSPSEKCHDVFGPGRHG